MNVKETLKKQGGMKLIKQYWKRGALFTVIVEFMLLGKSRTALEILRLCASLKIKQSMEKKYRWKLEEFDKDYVENEHQSSNIVWCCWLQGMENAPDLVKVCYESVKKNLCDRDIILITSQNMLDYVQFPIYIQEKIETGIIRGAHLSDLLRLELLIRYGGTWIDSTVYCSGNNVPSYMLNSNLFMFQNLKPGRDGHSTVISNWFITATSKNKLLLATQALLYEYWKENNELADYFIFHDFFQMVIDKYPDDWNAVIPFSNATPHILLLRLFEQYNPAIWEATTKMIPFHKLSYKFDLMNIQRENTYYQKIIRG